MRLLIATPIALAAALCADAALAACGAYPGLCFDPPTLMTPNAGKAGQLISNTAEEPSPVCDTEADIITGGSCGGMRTVCRATHMGNDDPILNPPGTVNGSHLHTFFGNVGVDGDTDVDALPAANSTCKGGILNRTAYWVPSMIDTRTGAALLPIDGTSTGVDIYYKNGVQLNHRINTFPAGFRMIFGNSTASSPQTGISYRCAGAGSPLSSSSSIQGVQFCGAGNRLKMSVDFGQCVALDGEAPFGTLSGTLAGWRIVPTFWEEQYFESTSATGNVTDIVVTAGGGAAVPTVVTTRQGTSTLGERGHITYNALTAGQWVEVAGLRYTSTGNSTALQVAQALQGGVPLTDSVDHKSHVAPVGSESDPKVGCPATHPYSTARLQFEISYPVTSAEQQKAMRLASDTYKGPGGYSGHGDFVFNWDTNLHRSWVFGCDRSGGDCHGHLVGCKDENNVTGQCRQIKLN